MADVGDLFSPAEIVEFAGNADGRLGIPKSSRSNFNGGGSGDEEFGRVFPAGDAAQSDDGNLDGARGFVDQAQGDGLDGRPGEAAEIVANAGTAGAGVNGE